MVLRELADISILDPEADVPFDPDDRLFSPESVLTYLPNLITMEEFGAFRIKFAHFSIQEYLLSQRITQRPTTKVFHIEETDAHLHIANSCLAYHLHLSRHILATEDTFQKFALWLYASQNWHRHIEKVANESLPDAINSRVAQLLDRRSQAFLNQNRIGKPNLRRPQRLDGRNWNLQPKEVWPPLCYCASLASLWPIRYLIKRGDMIDEVSDNCPNGFALQHAILERNLEVAKLLLHSGANVNMQGGKYGNALQAAAAFRNAEIVQLLVNNGADVNAQGGVYGTALQAAAAFGNAEVVQFLVDNGADVNIPGGKYGNALQAAISHSYNEITRFLLNNGADINAEGEYGNALQAAVHYRRYEIYELLLEMGADKSVLGEEELRIVSSMSST
jgi:hypothetical protein